MLRGSPISDEERKELNLKAEKIIDSLGITMRVTGNEFDALRKAGLVGYANYYLTKYWNKSELENKADVIIYKQLLAIDAKLGTTQSEQLRWLLCYSPRMDLIEV